MDSQKLYAKLNQFFPNKIDLMRHLHINACWEYIITKHSTKEEDTKLTFYLLKKNEKVLEMSEIKPDKIYLSSCLANAKPDCPYRTVDEQRRVHDSGRCGEPHAAA